MAERDKPSSSSEHPDYSPRDRLLEIEECYLNDDVPMVSSKSKSSMGRFWTSSVVGHSLLILVYTLLFLLILQFSNKSSTCTLSADFREVVPYTPALPAIKYNKQVIDSTVYMDSPYTGNPSKEIDNAWNDLMSGFNLRVSGETLVKINRTSIPLADGSGDYIAGLDTTHHLHCLQSIRHALAPEYYAAEVANMHKPEGAVYSTHIAHCLEILRMMILCKASGSLFTYAWSPTQHEPLTNFAVEHTCVDWEMLQEWTKENSFPIHDDLLVHPIFGKWPNGGPV